ncbi:MAG: hypothetical protein NTU41_13095 [Chloroflexi bacterium]|nr:hypothetical protein [Chloroflexota bacterium]
MGSKRLKAIAVRGTGGIPITRPAEALDCAQKFVALIRENIVFKDLSRFGTPTNHRDANALGRLRNRNFQRNQVPGGESLYADRLEEFSIGMAACFGCPVHCRHRYIVPEGPTRGSYAEGPEWCTIGALGSELDVGRMEALLVLNQMVNRYGMDSLEFGSMLAWAIELYEKGIIDDRATGGLKLEWGHEQVMYEMIQRTAHREGLGDVLAEGPLRAIEKLGQESAFYNIHVKGMSWLHTDERPTPTMALGVAVSTRGADHLRSRPGTDTYVLPPDVREKMYGFAPPAKMTSYEGGGKIVRWHELIYAISDSLGVCKFQALFMSPSTISYDEYGKMLGHVTGLELSPSQMTEAAERIYTLERMFNNREGAGRKDDNLPERYYVEPTPLGVRSFQGKTINRVKFDQQLDEYYDAHGWDRSGVPTTETLRTLGLDHEPSHLL